MRLCSRAGCFGVVDDAGQCNNGHGKAKPVDTRTRNASQRGYGWRWAKASRAFRQSNPWCAECERNGIVTRCNVVDHIVPHKDDQTLFWDQANWQALCKPCHDRKTATEDGGFGRTRTEGGRVES